MSAVLVIGIVVTGCTRQQPPTRASLPTVSTSSTTSAEVGPRRLVYGLSPGSVMTWNSEIVVRHELRVAVADGSALADGLEAAGIVDSTTEVTLEGIAETAVLATELVDVFTATSGFIAGTIGGEEFDRAFSSEEITALSNRRAGPPFQIDELGHIRVGKSGSPGAVGVEISGIAPLVAVGPPLTDVVIDVGDRWEVEVPGPLGSVLPLEVKVTGRDGADLLLDVAGRVDPVVMVPIELAAGRPVLPGTADVTILDRLPSVASGTVSIESIELAAEMRFNPGLGFVIDNRVTATVNATYQVSDPRGGGTAEIGELVEIDWTRFFDQTSRDGLDPVLARLIVDPTTLAFRPLAAIAGLGIVDLESTRLDGLMVPFAAVRADIFAAIVPAQVGTEPPVAVISFLLDGEVRGDPAVAAGVAAALSRADPTKDEVAGQPVNRIEQVDQQWTFWSTPTHLFLAVGDADLTDPIVVRLMDSAKPYIWQSGDCLGFPFPDTGVPFAPFGELHLSHCEAIHSHEVIHVEELAAGPDAPYPGEEAMVDRADLRCGGRFDAIVGGLDRDTTIEMVTYLPNQAEWELGARYLGCMVYLGGPEGVVPERGRLTSAAADHPSDLTTGDCARGDVRVDCEDPHPAEIIGSADFPDGPGAAFPGIRPGMEFADSACEDLLGRYGAIPGSLSIVAVGRPVSPYEWSTGVRDFLCQAAAVGADGTAVSVTGSFRTEWTPVP